MDQRHTNYYPQTKYLPLFLHLFLLNLLYYFFGGTEVKIPLNRTQLFLLKPWSKQPKGYHQPYNQGFPTFTLPTVILHLVWPPKVSTSFSFVIPKIECLGRIEGNIKYYGQRWSGKLKNGISFLWAPCCITDLCDIQITGRTMYGVLFWISGRRGLFSRSLSIWN